MHFIFKIITHWLVAAIAILIAAYFIPGVAISGYKAALIAAAALGFINLFIKPVIMVLTLPINLLTLGLFTVVIEAGLIMFTSHYIPGFIVSGFFPALLFAILLAIINSILHVSKK
jgi:putative membrane protein